MDPLRTNPLLAFFVRLERLLTAKAETYAEREDVPLNEAMELQVDILAEKLERLMKAEI